MTIEQVPSYVVWPLRQEVMYPHMDLESVKLPEDELGMHLALFDNNKLVSVVSLFKQGNDMQFRKFATLNACQGQGYGTALLKFVLKQAMVENCCRLWCNARETAAAFYEKFGFKRTDTSFFKDGHNFIMMELFLK